MLFDLAVLVHVIGALVIFGAALSYPVMSSRRKRRDPATLSALHSAQARVAQRLASPALVVVLLAGLELASHDNAFSSFYVALGFITVLVIGGLNGMVFAPQERRLAQLAQSEPGSDTYTALAERVDCFAIGASALVLITIICMALKIGS